MASWYDITFRDWSRELSTSQVFVPHLTALNITAELITIGSLRTAIEGIVLGETAKDRVVNNQQILSADAASSPLAQRENKWLVRYHGATTQKKFSLEIPTADIGATGRLLPDSDYADLTETGMAAFVAAFEAAAVSPDDDTEFVLVDTVQFVGRDL